MKKVKLNYLIKIALFAAVAGVLMLLELPLAIFPSFLKIDISDLPAVVAAVVLGPLAGALVELIKILLNFFLNGTVTGGIGELANLLIGVSLVVPIGLIYKKKPNLIGGITGALIGTVSLTLVGAFMNYFVLLPLYGQLFYMDFVEIGQQLPFFGQYINSMWDFVLFSIVPFNILKGLIVTLVFAVTYRFIVPPLQRLQD